MKTMRTRLITTAMTAVLVLAAPVAALAQVEEERPTTVAEDERPVVDIDGIKDRAAREIDRRLKTIDRLEFEIGMNDYVTDDHASQLLSELASSSAGLTALGEEIAAATTIDELRVLVPKIAEDYRIYLVVAPKVAETLASDTLVGVSSRFDEVGARIQDAIDRATEAGYDVSDAQSELDEMRRLVAEGVGLADPVAETVLPLQPSDWPDPAEDVLRQGREDLTDARQSLRQARDAAHDAIRSLKEAIGDQNE
jgi:hypothetical protein